MSRHQRKKYEAFVVTHSKRRHLTRGRGDGVKSPNPRQSHIYRSVLTSLRGVR